MRASVTEPAFTFRFEGNTRQDTREIAKHFLEDLSSIKELVWAEVEQCCPADH